jgi:hypothetical protein
MPIFFNFFFDWVYLRLCQMHGKHHQSRVGLGEELKHQFELYRELEVMEAVLSPGEVLYIPPYWFAKVCVGWFFICYDY